MGGFILAIITADNLCKSYGNKLVFDSGYCSILIYDKNDGYSPLHGHIAVTLGDGRTASDLIEIHPKKKPSAAFYPLKHEVASLDYEA